MYLYYLNHSECKFVWTWRKMLIDFQSSLRIEQWNKYNMDRVTRIWYLSPMRAAKVQASLRIRAVSPEPSLLAHTSSKSRGTFRQKTRSLAPLNGWTCAVEICHDRMLEDTNSLDGANMIPKYRLFNAIIDKSVNLWIGPRQANLCLRAFRHDKF